MSGTVRDMICIGKTTLSYNKNAHGYKTTAVGKDGCYHKLELTRLVHAKVWRRTDNSKVEKYKRITSRVTRDD